MKKKEDIVNLEGLMLTEETVTFTTKPCPDNHNRFQTYTAKKEFLNVCPNPQERVSPDLLGELNLPKYLHNTIGPAIIDPSNLKESNKIQYWIDGKRLKPEYAMKIQLGQKFDEEMETFLTEGDKANGA